MTSLHRPRFVRTLYLFLLLVPAASASAAGSSPESDFLSRIREATAKEDAHELNDLAMPGAPASFDWVERGAALMGRPRRWQVKLLETPGTGNGRFVAFTRYQLCESAADHLFPIVHTPDGPRLGPEIPETDSRGYRVRDHRLTVRLDIKHKAAFLTDRLAIERKPGAAPVAILRINSIYLIDSVKREGRPAPFTQAGGFVAVPFPDSAKAIFDLTYHARIEGSNEDYIQRNQAALTSYWYPHIGRLPATHSVKITVPKGWTAIGEGDPLGLTKSAETTTFAFDNRLAVCYFTIAAGVFTVTTEKVGNVPISAYMIHRDADRAKAAIRAAGKSLQWFSSNFGAFPYSRYTVVESDPYPAALECYSFTLCGKTMISIALVHEVAHSWWGGVVPNTYTRSLWNESFAEYSDGLYGRINNAEGVHEFNTRMVGMLLPIFRQVSLSKAHDAMEPAQSAVGYGKGSMVLENLEKMIGVEKMLACMRRFIQRHKPGEDAEWSDFVEAVADVAGKEWADYFPAWLDRTDLPEFRLSNVHVESIGDKFVVTGEIKQTEAAFWSRVPVVMSIKGGIVREQIDIKTSTTTFRIESAVRPTQIALDPNREILRTATKRDGSGDGTVVKLEMTE